VDEVFDDEAEDGAASCVLLKGADVVELELFRFS
jgi:hypothetical protein